MIEVTAITVAVILLVAAGIIVFVDLAAVIEGLHISIEVAWEIDESERNLRGHVCRVMSLACGLA